MAVQARWPRFAAACGLLYPLFLIGGDDFIAPTAGELPAYGDDPQILVEWLTGSNETQFFLGRFIGLVSLMFLLIFAAYVARQIRRLDDGWLSGAVLSAASVVAALHLSFATQFVAIDRVDQLDPVVAAAIFDLGWDFQLGFLPLGVFLGVAGAVAIRGELMARWIGWAGVILAAGLVVALLLLITGVDDVGWSFFPIALTWFIWFPAASISLIRRAGRARAGEPSAAELIS